MYAPAGNRTRVCTVAGYYSTTRPLSATAMGAAESSLSSSLRPEQQITTISERPEDVDPVLEKLKSLKIVGSYLFTRLNSCNLGLLPFQAMPILTTAPEESSLSDLLVRKPYSSSVHGTVNPKVILELFSMYRDWQEAKVNSIAKSQEELENKIDVVDALSVKLLQRFNYSVSAMKTTSQHLSGVQSLEVEIGELKGRLTEVMNNCDALCKRISLEGPESLQSSIKPFTAAASSGGLGTSYNLPSSVIAHTKQTSKNNQP
ncbi:hypothetical protein V2J09_001993 [Rumex salicifolius]